MNKKILLTGGTGFIGRHLILGLLQNNFSVCCLTRNSINKENFFPELTDKKFLKNLNFITCDLSKKESIKNKLNGFNIVLHFAGITKCLKDIDYFLGNYIGTKNLINELKNSNPGKIRFIFCSSQAAAGPANSFNNINEFIEPAPISLYGKSKLQAEKFILKNMDYLDYTILRPSAVFGKGEKDIAQYYDIIKKGIKIKITGSKKYFNLLYVKDLVNITLKILDDTQTFNKTFFIHDGLAYTWDSFTKALNDIFKKNLITIYIPEFLLKIYGLVNDALKEVTKKPTINNSDKFKELKYQYWLSSNKELLKILADYKFYNITTALKETIK